MTKVVCLVPHKPPLMSKGERERERDHFIPEGEINLFKRDIRERERERARSHVLHGYFFLNNDFFPG